VSSRALSAAEGWCICHTISQADSTENASKIHEYVAGPRNVQSLCLGFVTCSSCHHRAPSCLLTQSLLPLMTLPLPPLSLPPLLLLLSLLPLQSHHNNAVVTASFLFSFAFCFSLPFCPHRPPPSRTRVAFWLLLSFCFFFSMSILNPRALQALCFFSSSNLTTSKRQDIIFDILLLYCKFKFQSTIAGAPLRRGRALQACQNRPCEERRAHRVGCIEICAFVFGLVGDLCAFLGLGVGCVGLAVLVMI